MADYNDEIPECFKGQTMTAGPWAVEYVPHRTLTYFRVIAPESRTGKSALASTSSANHADACAMAAAPALIAALQDLVDLYEMDEESDPSNADKYAAWFHAKEALRAARGEKTELAGYLEQFRPEEGGNDEP